MSTIHTDQATVDRWLADGQWVEFAPGQRPSPRIGQYGHDYGTDPQPPADWKPEPCETCGGRGFRMLPSSEPCPHCGCEESRLVRTPCSDCNGSGVQRLAVTVPCRCGCENTHDPERVTVPGITATVEWGPLPVFGTLAAAAERDTDQTQPFIWIDRLSARALNRWDGERWHEFTLPPDIDPHTLVGQWARGGTSRRAVPRHHPPPTATPTPKPTTTHQQRPHQPPQEAT